MPIDLPDADPAHALARCVGDVDHFVAENFGQAPLLTRTADLPVNPDGSTPLTIDDIDELLTSRSLRAPAYRLVAAGTPLARSTYTRSGRIGGVAVTDLPDPGRIFEHVHQGATLVLQGLHRYWPAVTRLCRGIEDVLTHPVQANAYLTPPGNRGLNIHHDTHDVLALQLEGTKRWVVHEPAVEVPLASQRWSADEHQPGPLLIDTELHPGDCLYLPRGTPHAAQTTDVVSLHLTIGIRTVTWFDVIQQAITAAGDEATFREALPPGFAADPASLASEVAVRLEEAARWLRKVDPSATADDIIGRFHRQQQPRLEGQLRRVLALDEITADTVVVARRDVPVRIEHPTTDRVAMVLADRSVTLPAALTNTVTRLLDGTEVRVEDLPGPLDRDSRVVLARRLVREGALAVVGEGALTVVGDDGPAGA